MVTRSLALQPVTEQNFLPHGEFVSAAAGGENDARIDLSLGRPRFYVMRLERQPNRFHRITRHRRVTQCLGALMGAQWWIAVAPPGRVADAAARPDPESIVAFLIPGSGFIKLHAGTWHAGPHFAAPTVDFFNLELADTNEADHDTCDLARDYGLEFEFALPR